MLAKLGKKLDNIHILVPFYIVEELYFRKLTAIVFFLGPENFFVIFKNPRNYFLNRSRICDDFFICE